MRKILSRIENYILVIGLSGNIKFCNEKILNKLKLCESEIVNKNINELIKNKFINIEKIIEESKQGKEINTDLELVSKDNHKVLLNSEVLVDIFEGEESIFIIAKDLSDKFYNKEDLEMLLDTLPYNIWIKDKNGKYKYVNEPFVKLNNKDKSNNKDKLNIIGKNDNDIWESKEKEIFISIDKKICEYRTPLLREEHMIIENREEWFETYKAPILDQYNNVEYIVGQTRNITLRKSLNEKNTAKSKKILQLQEILNKGYNDVGNPTLLKDLGETLYKYLDADILVIQLFNEKNQQLEDAVSLGEKFKIPEWKNDKLKDYKLKYIRHNNELQGIKHLKEIKSDYLKSVMLGNNVNWMGMYNIMFNDEFMGMVSAYYKDENRVKIIRDDYLKSICNQIGTYLKNRELFHKISIELKKRRKMERDLQDFIEISVDLVGKFTADGNIISVNNKWTKTLGWSEEELLSMNILELIHLEDREKTIKIMENINEIHGCNINRVKCKDGSYRAIKWNYKRVEKGEFTIATARDITKQIEEEKQRQKLEEAIKLESFKNEFFANISHEFKTPLNIILGSIQLLNRNIELNNIDESSMYIKYYKMIKQNSYRLLRLVDNLIDITKMDTGFYELQLNNFNIVNIVENISLAVAKYIEYKGIKLTFDTNCEEQIIACDRDKIEKILLNLLSNAVKYIGKDGEIFVNLIADENKVSISVKDNGIGIDKEHIDEVFERFKQVDEILTRRCEGSGIGLSLVKSLIELHGGNIYVKSEVGIGSEFTFELPIKLIESKEINLLTDYKYDNFQIEKCSIEFSDIYE